jgi:hypothetical protein
MMPRLLSFLVMLVAFGPASAADDVGRYSAEAEQVLQRLRGAMMAEMQKAMQVGPKEAIGVCRHLAPRIEAQIEAESGWEVRRTASRVRNPANAPAPDERGVLLGFEVRLMAGQDPGRLRSLRLVERDGKRMVHFMQAVPMFDTCLACHGTDIAPDVLAAINELYPEDQATGYAVGEIRGAFSLYKPFDPSKPPSITGDWAKIAELALPSSVDLDGSGKTGDPANGRDAFKSHCKSCHSPIGLASHVFDRQGTPEEPSLCRKLETHGISDAATDCDIVAFMKVLAGTTAAR